MGVDDRGALVVIELKHGAPDRDAIAQVIEYAGFLSDMQFEDLSRHLTPRSTSSDFESIADFAAEYRERYGSPPSAGVPVRPALVSTGLDRYTVRSIAYLRDAGLPLDFFWIQERRVADGPAIVVHRNPRFEFAKQWYAPPNLKGRNRRKWILDEASRLDIGPLYQRLYEVVGEHLQPGGSWVAREDTDSLGLCRSLSRRLPNGKTSHRECLVIRILGYRLDRVWMFAFDELVDLAPRKTRAFLKHVEHQRDGIPGKTSGYSFWMTEADWDRHGDEFRDLLAYMGKRWREKIGK